MDLNLRRGQLRQSQMYSHVASTGGVWRGAATVVDVVVATGVLGAAIAAGVVLDTVEFVETEGTLLVVALHALSVSSLVVSCGVVDNTAAAELVVGAKGGGPVGAFVLMGIVMSGFLTFVCGTVPVPGFMISDDVGVCCPTGVDIFCCIIDGCCCCCSIAAFICCWVPATVCGCC